MTVRELYKWAREQKVLDFDIEIPWRDSGGYFDGCDDAEPAIAKREHSWNTEQVVVL